MPHIVPSSNVVECKAKFAEELALESAVVVAEQDCPKLEHRVALRKVAATGIRANGTKVAMGGQREDGSHARRYANLVEERTIEFMEAKMKDLLVAMESSTEVKPQDAMNNVKLFDDGTRGVAMRQASTHSSLS